MTTSPTHSGFMYPKPGFQTLPNAPFGPPKRVGYLYWQFAFVGAFVWLGIAHAMAQADHRASPETKLQAATDFIQRLVDEDRAPMKGFYGRSGYGVLGICSSYGAVRAIELQPPRFESKRQNIVVVPVIAELLYIQASGGGKSAASNRSNPIICAFEYERWSFDTRKFERLPGFHSRKLRDEFVNWGEHRFEDNISRFVLIDLDKRYVRFHARVNVNEEQVLQLAPDFPRHYDAMNMIKVVDRSSQRKIDLIALGRSDNSAIVFPVDVAKDLPRMQWQLQQDSWISSGIKQRLESLQSTPSFQEISK